MGIQEDKGKIKIRAVILSFVIFTIIFSSISIVNHYNFRTSARDLGIKTNEIYDYAHFRFNECTLLPNYFSNKLSDHFSLYPIFFSPFSYIFKTYTLLIFQILFVLFGGLGIFKYVQLISQNSRIALWAMIHFFSLWGIYSALAFDYHDNVIAAMLIPWLLIAIHKDQKLQSLILLFLILIGKENMALWAFFICLGLIFHYFKQKNKIRFISILAAISIVYFYLVLNLFIPALSNPDTHYNHFKYDALGNDFTEAFKCILTKPFYTISLLFTNHSGDPAYNGIKLESWLAFLISGGILTILKPQFLVMLIPVFAQKMFNDDYQIWGVNFQYSIEFVPILSISAFYMLSDLKQNKRIRKLSLLLIFLAAIVNVKLLDSRTSKWYKPEKSRFYDLKHYQREIDVKKVNESLKLIPKDAIVSAQNMLLSHLALRDHIYLLPEIENAEYIVVSPDDHYIYPFENRDEYQKLIKILRESPNWEILTDHSSITIFKRK